MPLVSVIVPVYKVEAELPRCVESLLSQSMGDIEVILVDDGSPDGCPVMCDEYARRDARVRVVHKENGGLSDARNAGLDVASGEYVMFVDSDDYIEPDSCEVLLAAAREHGSDLVVGDWHDVPDKGRVHYTNLEEGRVYTGRDFVLASLKRNEWYPCACFLLYSKKHLDVHGFRFATGLLHEDMEMQPRLYLSARRIVVVKYCFYNYIRHEGTITTSANKERRAHDMGVILARWLACFEKIGDVELRRALMGYLVKVYLHVCRECGTPQGLGVEGVGNVFLFKHGRNLKERAKALLFAVAPRLYCKL